MQTIKLLACACLCFALLASPAQARVFGTTYSRPNPYVDQLKRDMANERHADQINHDRMKRELQYRRDLYQLQIWWYQEMQRRRNAQQRP